MVWPDWVSLKNIAPYLSTLPGWFVLFRSIRSERVKINFLFRGTDILVLEVASNGEDIERSSPAVQFTVMSLRRRAKITWSFRSWKNSVIPVAVELRLL
jgi:hypothetical protein